MSPADKSSLAQGVRAQNRQALAQAITLIESTHPDHWTEAEFLLRELLPNAGQSMRIGITGIPGVGKSTLIEALGLHVIDQGHRLAVLAVDPSSPRSGGAILGDKTRMAKLANAPQAYIRPSPSRGTLGGVARCTREAITVCEAAGFDVIVIETVGVGQSETTVAELVDLFMLLLAPGGGDELQGIKKGIVELADLIVVNKADGELKMAAERTRADYASALALTSTPLTDTSLTDAGSRSWQPRVLTCSALEGEGISAIWSTIEEFFKEDIQRRHITERRERQNIAWMAQELSTTLLEHVQNEPSLKNKMTELEADVGRGIKTPRDAAQMLFDALMKK